MVAAILLVSMLPGQDVGDYSQRGMSTLGNMYKVEEAMKSFMLFNGRRPCPADGQYPVDSANFGIEAANPGSCTGGTPAAPFGPDAASGNVVAGVIPTKSLNLPDEYAFDDWGRRITYVVDKRATEWGSCINLMGMHRPGIGSIEVRDGSGGVLAYSMYGYISHGTDGHGAFPAQGSTVANRINAGNTDSDTLENASVNGAFATNFNPVFIRKEKTSTFDDIVYYADPYKDTCCIGVGNCMHTGFRVDGVAASDQSGSVVATGDVNGDGITDLIIGLRYTNSSAGAGSAYVVFGTRSGFPNPLPLASLTGSNGFRLDGQLAGDAAGYSIAAGDVNGDGIADIIVGAPFANFSSGASYVVFGHGGSWPAAMPLASLDGTNGFRLDGTNPNDISGFAVAAGDVNGDGRADVIVGAPLANFSSGASYVVFGHGGSWGASLPLA